MTRASARRCLYPSLRNAHPLRERVSREETTVQAWPRKMIDFLCRPKDQADAAKLAQRPLARMPLSGLRHQYESILTQDERDKTLRVRNKPKQRGGTKQSPAVNIFLRLRQDADDVPRFLADLRVTFDNTPTERDIRMPRLKQKTTGCIRTITGAESFCTIRAYFATLRKQGRDVLHPFTLAFRGQAPDPLPSG